MSDRSLIAATQSSREIWTGSALGDSIEGLVDAIRSQGWVDDLLAGAAFGVEVAATVLDPFSALLANGLGWAMEYFEPLRQILDDLTGIPDQVAAHAATWENIAGHLRGMAGDLQTAVGGVTGWTGDAAQAYQGLMGNNVDAVSGLGAVATAMGEATRAAGNLVSFTRETVRDLIADLVARVVVWVVEAIFVVTIPVIAEQICVAVVKWAGRILTYVTALLTSLTNLATLLGR